jgi:ketosteroid isomerase-like protein
MDEAAALERLQRVTDDLEIRRVITDYASLIDAREWDRLVGVFAPDFVVEYHNGRTRVEGAQAAVDYIQENTAHLAWQHHFVSPYGVDVDGDQATAQAYLVSHQVIANEPTTVLMMAATYDLRLKRGESGWQLAHMVHAIRVANYLPITTSPPGGAFVPPAVRH